MPSKHKPKLGQNFLVDEAAQVRIADALGDVRESTVVEIGPGRGAITQVLAGRARRLVCIELDRALAAELTFRYRNDAQVEVLHQDILATDLAKIAKDTGSPLVVIGNLPYYITSDILLHLYATVREPMADGQPSLARAVVMMQREVADRVAAQPGSRDYGMLSATTQMYADARTLFTLPPSAFSPPPEVTSSVVRLDVVPRWRELGVPPAAFEAFLRQCFAQKRKTLVNNLRVAGVSTESIHGVWPSDLDPQVRAEAVPLTKLAEVYRSLHRASAEASAS
jgi:16S rRNA (adenine1518-N6/adenine1519-N6)-dimethyltransferase